MSWTKEEIKEMTGVLMRRAHGDGRDRQEVETICLLAETSIMNRESCERLMDKVEELKTDHAAEVEKLEGELVEQARLLGMGGEREAKLMAEVAALRERVRVLEEKVEAAYVLQSACRYVAEGGKQAVGVCAAACLRTDEALAALRAQQEGKP